MSTQNVFSIINNMAIRKKTFKGNANLKREGVQIEWTEETMSEYIKCSQDPIYFVKNYYTIVSIDKGKILFPPHPFQEDIINTVADNRFTIVRVGRQSGKCVVASTTVTVKNRETKVVEDVAIGDFHKRCMALVDITVNHEDLELPNSSDDDKKFIERVDTHNYDVLTNKGWSPLSQTNKTIQYDEWDVVLEDGNRITCADDHIFITKDMEEVFAKDCVGAYLNTAYGPQRVISAMPNGSKSHMYDLTVNDEDHLYYTNDILSHNTTVSAAVLLWYLLFKKDMSIAILAHKLAGAREILSRMQTAYEGLPFWLQQGVREWTKTSIVLENGSKAIASATTGSAVRGGSFGMLYLDEFAWIPRNAQNTFFASVLPTISSSKESKILITSTPNGLDMFYNLWQKAIQGENDYIPIDVHWSDIPGRDEAWKEETIRNSSVAQFNVEYECVDANTLITVKDVVTGIVHDVTIKDFYDFCVDIDYEEDNTP